MPHATTDDGVRLYYEETGSGRPVIFVHEYAGDYRSWEPQMRHFGQRYRAITYNARGYPPSDVPEDVAKYSQARAADDIRAVLDHLKIDKAHVVGLSMGGFATLHYGFRHPARALSLCVAGCGYGAERGQTERFRAEAETIAAFIHEQGMEVFAAKYAYGPTRVQFENKDPRGFAEFKQHAGGALGPGRAQHAAWRAARAAVALRSGRSDEGADVADAGADRRRGLALPGAGPADEADDTQRRAVGDAELRPRDQHRGSRRIQPHRRRVHRPGGCRTMAEAGSARGVRLDHRDALALGTGAFRKLARRNKA